MEQNQASAVRREHVAAFARQTKNNFRAKHGWFAWFLVYIWR